MRHARLLILLLALGAGSLASAVTVNPPPNPRAERATPQDQPRDQTPAEGNPVPEAPPEPQQPIPPEPSPDGPEIDVTPPRDPGGDNSWLLWPLLAFAAVGVLALLARLMRGRSPVEREPDRGRAPPDAEVRVSLEPGGTRFIGTQPIVVQEERDG